ncbi:MAG: hypothetical protein LUH17_06290 [Acidaminococcaceae bacterium]|nr:hypothetical protein [Acidaminococcaceae bacterium]
MPLQKQLDAGVKLLTVCAFSAVQDKLPLLFKGLIIIVNGTAAFGQQCFDAPVQLCFKNSF